VRGIQLADARYICNHCKQDRNYILDESSHHELVDKSPNGLVMYSDSHRCQNGIIGINNLQIDKHFSVRGFTFLELPQRRIPKASGLNIPVPRGPSPDQMKMFSITQIPPDEKLRIMIIDHMLNVKINIGKVNENEELSILTINSDMGLLEIVFYPSEIPFTPTLEKWFTILVNIMEVLPATKIGLIVDTLKYVLDSSFNEPIEFDIIFLKTILASHEIYFEMIEDGELSWADHLAINAAPKYREKDVAVMMKIMAHLEENPYIPLQQYVSKELHQDLRYLIYIFLLLEVEGLIRIERPGIIEEERWTS
jgi:hypothetical protein